MKDGVEKTHACEPDLSHSSANCLLRIRTCAQEKGGKSSLQLNGRNVGLIWLLKVLVHSLLLEFVRASGLSHRSKSYPMISPQSAREYLWSLAREYTVDGSPDPIHITHAWRKELRNS
jgi:hypothetical protein